MKYTKDNFPEIESQPNSFWTWFIRIIFAFLIALILLSIFCIPVLLYVEGEFYGTEAVIFLAIYYPVLCLLLYKLVGKIRKSKQKAVYSIVVNKEGAFYKKHNGTVEALLFKDLQRSAKGVIDDVYIKSAAVGSHRLVHLKVFYGGREVKVDFGRIDVAFASYASNHRALRQHFIQGVELFRPDLSIDPAVFNEYFINPDTFEFDRKSHRNVIIFTVLFVLLMTLAVFLWNSGR